MRTIIIGGGLTGISCAYKLQSLNKDFLIIEKENELGGLCRSVYKNGFVFDYTGHFLHFQDKNIKRFVESKLNKNILCIKRNSKIYTEVSVTKDKLIPYPFQANIDFLKPEVKKFCVEQLLFSNLSFNNIKYKNFYHWCINNFGAGISKNFLFPYNSKLWLTDLKKISYDWVEKFVPKPDIQEILENILTKKLKDYGYNINFYYPKYGGIQSLINSISKCLDNRRIIKNDKVVKIDVDKKNVYLSSGEIFSYNKLVSTIPLVDFLKISTVSQNIKSLIDKLKYTTVLCFNIALKKKTKQKTHWIYFPAKDLIFYRIGFYHNINENLVLKNCGSLYVEISVSPKKNVDEKMLYKKILYDLKKIQIISSTEDILFYDVIKIPVGYVIYDLERKFLVEKIQKYLSDRDIYSIGRYGGWKYSYMEENIKEGFDVVKKIIKL
ncbi:MAG: FAD-dependent oxidoreductase [Endomicrobiia bacterium]